MVSQLPPGRSYPACPSHAQPQRRGERFLTLTEYSNLVNRMYLLGGIAFFCAAPFYIWSWIDASVIGGIIPIPGRLQLKQAKVCCCLSLPSCRSKRRR